MSVYTIDIAGMKRDLHDDLPPEPLRILFSPEGCVPDEFLFSQLAKAVYTI